MDIIPNDLKYSKTHEWARIEGDVATIGVSHHAQAELGDIVYLALPEPGRILREEEQFGEVESVKAVSELFAPVAGEVVDANTAIQSKTEIVNEDPYGEGWLVKIKLSDTSELSHLMTPEDYKKFVEAGAH